MAKTKSELLFERLLKNRGYKFIKGEDFFPKAGKCPDYYIITKYGDLICEVKEFIEPEIHKRIQKHRIGTFSSKSILNPIRNKIKAASTQLKPYTKYDVPMILILANPYGYFVDLSNEEILSAMYGEIGLSIPLRDDKNPEWFFGRDEVLTNQKDYISAICVLERVPIRCKKLE